MSQGANAFVVLPAEEPRSRGPVGAHHDRGAAEPSGSPPRGGGVLHRHWWQAEPLTTIGCNGLPPVVGATWLNPTGTVDSTCAVVGATWLNPTGTVVSSLSR